MNPIMAVILAGGQGQRLSVLSELRAKPAVPFGGKYRLIDFTLSNCVNSGITSVALLTQYLPQSLREHIEIGRPWDLDRMDGGVTLLQPSLGAGTRKDWYSGTANAVYQNLFRLKLPSIQDILVLSGDHIYKMDYSEMASFHRTNKAQATIAVMPVDIKEASRFGIMELDTHKKIVKFEEKPKNPKSNLASMGIYLFNRETLETVLMADAGDPKSSHDFGQDIIPKMIHSYRTFGYEFRGYWRDVGTIPSYYQANMDLLEDPPLFDLDDSNWVIHTKSEEKPPVKLDINAKVFRSLVANGCIINGYVEHSILFPGVIVESDAVIQNSIIFSNTVIGNNSRIERSILDKLVHIGAHCSIGMGEKIGTPNQGIAVIGKGTHIPPNTRIESDCIIDRGLREEHFLVSHITAGEIFKKKKS
jgi:glucose-1-phosphate adenylyltransferase